MANKYLRPLFKRIFEEDFSYSDFDKRLEMQKGIYLLQEMGVSVGDFGFSWYKHGPYSQALQDAMFHADSGPVEQIQFSEYVEYCINKLNRIFVKERPAVYTKEYWAECLASMLFLRENVLPETATFAEINSTLKKRKPHLNDDSANQKAYELLSVIAA